MRGNNVIFVFWVWTISLCMITFSFSYFPTNDIISFMLCVYGLQLLLFSGLLVYLRKSFPMLISWGVFPLFSCSRRWVWWCILKMIFFRKQRQENCYKFKASLTYIVSSGWSGIDSERQYQWNKTKKKWNKKVRLSFIKKANDSICWVGCEGRWTLTYSLLVDLQTCIAIMEIGLVVPQKF